MIVFFKGGLHLAVELAFYYIIYMQTLLTAYQLSWWRQTIYLFMQIIV